MTVTFRDPLAPMVRAVLPVDLPHTVGRLLQNGGRMQMAYGRFLENGAVELRYVASRGAGEPFEIWICHPDGSAPSISGVSPLMGWYEREITDLCGTRFIDQPDPSPLLLHDGVQASCPLLERDVALRLTRPGDGGAPEVSNPDIQRLPFGPVRADVVESAELIFFYVGERILHFHPQLFFKHRGMEKRFEGCPLPKAMVLAERISGVGSFSHALAFCQAVEHAAGCLPPPRALMLRALLAELERIYNHLHYLGHLAHTTTLKVGEAQGKLLEEQAKQINGRLTGSRFLRGLLQPGGLRRDIRLDSWLVKALTALRHEAGQYMAMLERTSSHLDRLMTTGFLDRRTAFDQGATGPVERASGLDRDLRRDHPYAAYSHLSVAVPVQSKGDAHARAQIRMAELEASFALIDQILEFLPDGTVCLSCQPLPEAEGLGWVEGPRGTLFYTVHFGADGRLSRVKIKSPSFSNWRVFPFSVHDSNMMDYAINEASFGLTVAGCDR
ncbi:formate hydrogenlyase subunit 5 precursor [mine drainage metagenome]|uniref:Formate hydrogenlyase subunit 5 n=1 Tax=mine drainage metagenome TaxID=410659 RepID=A0A1J5R573_9ZZZZ